MKIREVILRAIAKKVTWFQAAEIAGLSARHMRRLRWRYENLGYDGLLDRRRGSLATNSNGKRRLLTNPLPLPLSVLKSISDMEK